MCPSFDPKVSFYDTETFWKIKLVFLQSEISDIVTRGKHGYKKKNIVVSMEMVSTNFCLDIII